MYYYGGPWLIGPNIVGKNSETYRFLLAPKVLFNMVLRNTVGGNIMNVNNLLPQRFKHSVQSAPTKAGHSLLRLTMTLFGIRFALPSPFMRLAELTALRAWC